MRGHDLRMSRWAVAFYPGKMFPSLSITGSNCELQCAHCRGRYLESMIPATSPGELMRLARQLVAKGANGFLLSGGCLRDGTMPFDDFLGALETIKRELPLEINMHTGLLDRRRAGLLASTGVDVFSLDLTPDVWGTEAFGRGAYGKSITNLLDTGVSRVVPHLCLGIPDVVPERECEALEFISQLGISALVVLVFIPTKGTPLEGRRSPAAERVLDFIRRAKERLDCPVLIGCMRPRGVWEMEALCLQAGVDALAVPSRKTLDWARENGYRVEIRQKCCALY
jgi:lipoyl synthase